MWNDNKEKSGMWSEVMVFGYASLHGNRNFPGSQKVKRSDRQHCASKMAEPVCRLANNTEMQMPTLSRQLLQTNNSSVKPLSLGHKPQLAGQLCPARLTEVGDQGMCNDNKEKSGMWSEVMGLWAYKAAWKCDSPRSQKVKRSVATISEPVCHSAKKRGMQMSTL